MLGSPVNEWRKIKIGAIEGFIHNAYIEVRGLGILQDALKPRDKPFLAVWWDSVLFNSYTQEQAFEGILGLCGDRIQFNEGTGFDTGEQLYHARSFMGVITTTKRVFGVHFAYTRSGQVYGYFSDDFRHWQASYNPSVGHQPHPTLGLWRLDRQAVHRLQQKLEYIRKVTR